MANLLLSVGSALAALAFWTHAGVSRPIAYALGMLSLWQLRCAIGWRSGTPVILRLGGFSWDIFSFCRGWLITGPGGYGEDCRGNQYDALAGVEELSDLGRSLRR